MNKAKIKGKWLCLTEETNALDYLEQACCYICQTEKNTTAWKWVILALNGALYGFLICAVRGTSNDSVLKWKELKGKHKINFTGPVFDDGYVLIKKSADGNHQFIRTDRLIGFDDALALCQDPRKMKMFTFSKHLQLSNQQKESIKKLRKEFRNNFEHYVPKNWVIEIHGMPQIAIDVLEVIRFLVLDAGNCVHLTQEQKAKIEGMILQGKQILGESQLYKESELVNSHQ